jgi:D-glycero-D-manno-heptose 1,7-bisphosphate phosphatase
MNDMLDLRSIDKSWTLFLDRDGVINEDKPNSYIFNWEEFAFYDDVLESIAYFGNVFGHILVATNQRGVGKGLMTVSDLSSIHEGMMSAIKKAGGRIDKIYACITNDNEDPDRKPNPGMAFRAQKDFPDIDLTKSIMVGNNISDMQFGRNAGMQTVFVKSTIPDIILPNPDIDLAFNSLPDFAKALQIR